MFKCFPIPFCSRNLEQIDKRHCNLTSVPDDVLRHTRTLEELLLDANQLQDLPKGIYRLTQLRRLTISDNEIQRILPDIGQLVNLEEFDCSRNDIAEIPENIRHCRSLQRFDFSGNPLAHNLPSGIIHLHQLNQLTLNDVSLAELPKEIGSLANLRVLEVRENLLKTLPDSLVKLSKLESLDLGSNVIEQLPRNIGNLQSLKELWLDSNELYHIPSDIGKLKRLQCLDISENKLTYLPDEIGDLESLTNFELSSNHIERIPDSIGNLQQHLLIVKVNSNNLSSLCEKIGQCLALTELILTENALVELPKTIGNLKHLTNLNVDRNQLMYLPVEIAECESLGMLSLRDNRLLKIPSELSKLKHLHVLDLSGNRLLNLPCTLLQCDLKAIWLAENQAQPMLKFATDVDPNTGESVLTCYLLPQQSHSTSSMENLLNTPKIQSVTGEVTHVARPSVQLSNSEPEDASNEGHHERTGSVKFVDQAEASKESSLQRHNTPHPKDLRSWKNKMAKKYQTDGNLLHHDHQHPFQPNSHTHTDVKRPSVTSTGSVTQANRATTDSGHEMHESIDYIPPEISTDDYGRDSNNEYEDEVNYIEKHVEFTDNLHDDNQVKESSNQQKLHRRDTPHHLKNKRIITKDKNSATIDQIMSHSPTKSSVASGGRESISSLTPNSGRSATVRQEQVVLNVHRSPNTGLGISIAGGCGSAAYKDNDYGIFLTKVTEEGPASQAGLCVGDKLLSVNGISLLNCEHNEAVSVLKTAGDNIEMVVIREVLQSPDDNVINNENVSTTLQQDEQFNGSKSDGHPSVISEDEDSLVPEVNAQGRSGSSDVDDRRLSTNSRDAVNTDRRQMVDIVNKEGNSEESTICQENIVTEKRTSASIIIDNTVEEIHVEKGNGPMGLSIVGGIDQICPPFGTEQRGVFVSKILVNGSASRTNLRIGDRILKVNDRDISQATHLEAVQALLQPASEVTLLVRHEPQPAGFREVTLIKQPGEPLGIRINGGINGKQMNPDDPNDDGIFVTEVKEGSPASGILTVGTRILEVNNQSLFGAHLDDAQKWLSVPSGSINLLICHGLNSKELRSSNNASLYTRQPSINNDATSPSNPMRTILTQETTSPVLSAKSNGALNSPSTKRVSLSSKPATPTSPQEPSAAPIRPKYRPLVTQFVPLNGDNQPVTTARCLAISSQVQPQNGFETDQLDVSTQQSEKVFNEKKTFSESCHTDSGPRPKPRQLKYINEHELLQMKQEEEQKVKIVDSIELFQSRTMCVNDKTESGVIHKALSQYQTPNYLATPEDDYEDDDDASDSVSQKPASNLLSSESNFV